MAWQARFAGRGTSKRVGASLAQAGLRCSDATPTIFECEPHHSHILSTDNAPHAQLYYTHQVPFGHREQTVEPAMAKVPSSHRTGAIAGFPQRLPAGHNSQAAAPTTSAKKPRAQATHPRSPSALEVPAAQGFVLCKSSQLRPGGQS